MVFKQIRTINAGSIDFSKLSTINDTFLFSFFKLKWTFWSLIIMIGMIVLLFRLFGLTNLLFESIDTSKSKKFTIINNGYS